MLALGALVGIVLAFFSVLENRAVGLLGLAAAALTTNIFTIGLVIGFFVSSGVISQIEGEDFSWQCKVNWYVTGTVFATIVTTFFVMICLPYLSPMIIIQVLIILRTMAWIWAIIEDRNKVTIWDIIGIGIVLFLAWFGIKKDLMNIAFVYFSAMRLNLVHNVKKVIRSSNKQWENDHIDNDIIPIISNPFRQAAEILILALFDFDVKIDDDNDLRSPLHCLRAGYADGAQFVIIALLASQRDMINTILQISLSGDAVYMFVVMCIGIVLITRCLLGEWFVRLYNILSTVHLFTIFSYISVGFNIVVMLTVSPYAILYCLAGILVCNICNKYVKRISLTALPAFGVFG